MNYYSPLLFLVASIASLGHMCRNNRIQQNRDNGQLLEFDKNFRSLTTLPPEPAKLESKEEEPPTQSTDELTDEAQRAEDPPAASQGSISSMSMEDDKEDGLSITAQKQQQMLSIEQQQCIVK